MDYSKTQISSGWGIGGFSNCDTLNSTASVLFTNVCSQAISGCRSGDYAEQWNCTASTDSSKYIELFFQCMHTQLLILSRCPRWAAKLTVLLAPFKGQGKISKVPIWRDWHSIYILKKQYLTTYLLSIFRTYCATSAS